MRKLRERDEDLAGQVQKAIDAGKDVSETEPATGRRNEARVYRKTVPFTHEEALHVALDALQSYFVELPLFANSAADNFAKAAVEVTTERQAVAEPAEVHLVPPPPGVLSRLLEMSQDDDVEVRRSAAESLHKMGSAAATPEVLTRLLEMLLDEDELVAVEANEALYMLGPAAASPEVLARLLELTRDAREFPRACAAALIGRMYPNTSTTEMLIRILEMTEDEKDLVRSTAAWSFGEIGRAATTAKIKARLMQMARHDVSQAVRKTAAEVLARITAGEPAPTSREQEGSDKAIEIELHTETQITRTGDETLPLKRLPLNQIAEQIQNIKRLRHLTNFVEE